MKKIILFSDLHLECHADYGKSVISNLSKDVDIAVVPGDLANSRYLKKSIISLCSEFPHVVFVSGNHSYYHSTSFDQVDHMLDYLENKLCNFTWLNDKRVMIEGLNFIGATLWFPRSIIANNNKHLLNDFSYIKDCDPIAYERHEKTVDFFNNNMEKGDIMVTHHMPSYKCVNDKYKNSSLNCYFACDLDELIKDKKPSMAFCGHTHLGFDFMLYKTRMMCNPLGYYDENPYFNDSFTIEV